MTILWAMLWLKRLITRLSQKRPGFNPTLTSVGFVVDKVALRLVFLLVLRYQWGHAVAQLVEALRYKPEGRGFNSRWCHWIFSLT